MSIGRRTDKLTIEPDEPGERWIIQYDPKLHARTDHALHFTLTPLTVETPCECKDTPPGHNCLVPQPSIEGVLVFQPDYRHRWDVHVPAMWILTPWESIVGGLLRARLEPCEPA